MPKSSTPIGGKVTRGLLEATSRAPGVAEGEAIILGENRAWQTTLSKPDGDHPDKAS